MIRALRNLLLRRLDALSDFLELILFIVDLSCVHALEVVVRQETVALIAHAVLLLFHFGEAALRPRARVADSLPTLFAVVHGGAEHRELLVAKLARFSLLVLDELGVVEFRQQFVFFLIFIDEHAVHLFLLLHVGPLARAGTRVVRLLGVIFTGAGGLAVVGRLARAIVGFK